MVRTAFLWTDERIIESILAGGRQENAAIEALYLKHKQVLLSLIVSKSNKVYALEPSDVFMEAIVAFVDNVKDKSYQLQEEVSIGIYLNALCKKIWYKYLLSESSREDRNEKFIETTTVDELDVANVLANKEIWDLYLAIFEQAGPACKEILLLSFEEDLPVKEVAELLINEGKFKNDQTVRNAKSKCLKRVIDLLDSTTLPLNPTLQ